MMPTEYFLAHIWMIPLFPLAGAALIVFIGWRLPNIGVNVVCVGSVFLSMCFAFGAIWQLIARPAAERVVSYNMFDWVPAGVMHTNAGRVMDFHVPWGVLMDPLTAVMLLVVTGVGFLIHVYSTGYTIRPSCCACFQCSPRSARLSSPTCDRRSRLEILQLGTAP